MIWTQDDDVLLDDDAPDLGSLLGTAEETATREDAWDSPRDEPLAVEDYGTTGAEEAHDEPLSAHLRRELPDTGRRPTPSAYRFAGRLLDAEGAAAVAVGDTGGFSAEEAAMHTVRPPTPPRRSRGLSTSERVELLESEVGVLLETSRTLVEALTLLASGLETIPSEDREERARRAVRAARQAHELLLDLARPT